MNWITRSLPTEPDEDPPEPSRLGPLEAERAALLAKVRRGIRSRRQEQILRRIGEITRQLLAQGDAA
ncbi:MAG TPA: hypothetical protein PLQ12_03160 [Candidatus Defluviicoccus seviourii]|nr:hypothetical protein [Candidatus Defluviicoccus seviourii]